MDNVWRWLHNLFTAIFGLFAGLLTLPVPVSFTGRGSATELARAVARSGATRLLVVSDRILTELGLVGKITAEIEASGIEITLYDGVEPNPTVAQAEAGLALYREHSCDAVLAIGGGSPIDAAKAIAAAATNKKPVRKLAGMFKVRAAPAPLFAVPTTAGTGSETTIVSVVSDPATHNKLQIIDPKLVPLMTALDPEVMAGMPPPVTAATGMDALTHAVESFLSTTSNAETERYVRMAVPLIFTYLPRAFRDGNDLEARNSMALASFYAGVAFTRTSVGYVHAIAHTFGARYDTPHGLANAITLPHILAFSEPAARDRLALLAEMIDLPGETAAAKAAAFLAAVGDMIDTLEIPRHLDSLRPEDIGSIARQALGEAWCNYPVPRYMEQSECESILRAIAPATTSAASQSAGASR